MGWNLRCTARCLVPISRRNILPPKLLVRALQGGPRHQCCQQVFGLSPANLGGLHGKGKKWIHEGQPYRARFAVTCPAHDSVPKRRDRPQRLTSWPAHKPAEQERLYFHLNTDRTVRRHEVPDRAPATKGLNKCKHSHRPRDQQGERRHDVTILTRSRERGKGLMWD